MEEFLDYMLIVYIIGIIVLLVLLVAGIVFIFIDYITSEKLKDRIESFFSKD